jgi:hypothetical protein
MPTWKRLVLGVVVVVGGLFLLGVVAGFVYTVLHAS